MRPWVSSPGLQKEKKKKETYHNRPPEPQPCAKATATSHKNNSARTSAQQLPVQPWTDSTLVIDPHSQGLLFKNVCTFPHVALKCFYLPQPPSIEQVSCGT
jgi:hypothetical protein